MNERTPTRNLPTDDELWALYAQGMNMREVADHFGMDHTTVRSRFRRMKDRPDKQHTPDVFPDNLLPEHRRTMVHLMLERYVRRAEGKELQPPRLLELEDWEAMLEMRGLIVVYDPQAGPNEASPRVGGYGYDARRPGEQGIIRKG
jgi:hypothetical protein